MHRGHEGKTQGSGMESNTGVKNDKHQIKNGINRGQEWYTPENRGHGGFCQWMT